MKKLFKHALILLLLLLVIAGCSLSRSPEKKTMMSCDNLIHEENQKTCHEQTEKLISSYYSQEILDYFDSGRCAELTPDSVQNCQDMISQTGVKGPITSEEKSLLDKNLQLDETTQKFDLKECAGMKTPGLQAYCQKQVQVKIDEWTLEEAYKNKDKTMCQSIISEESKNRCEALVDNLEKNPTPEVTP